MSYREAKLALQLTRKETDFLITCLNLAKYHQEHGQDLIRNDIRDNQNMSAESERALRTYLDKLDEELQQMEALKIKLGELL